MIYDMIASG